LETALRHPPIFTKELLTSHIDLQLLNEESNRGAQDLFRTINTLIHLRLDELEVVRDATSCLRTAFEVEVNLHQTPSLVVPKTLSNRDATFGTISLFTNRY
jgi:hypothetical protein